MIQRLLNSTIRTVWKVIILVIGLTVVAFGCVLFFTPGPAVLVIPIGLAILATEFAWARRLLRQMKESGKNFARSAGLLKKEEKEGAIRRGGEGEPEAACGREQEKVDR